MKNSLIATLLLALCGLASGADVQLFSPVKTPPNAAEQARVLRLVAGSKSYAHVAIDQSAMDSNVINIEVDGTKTRFTGTKMMTHGGVEQWNGTDGADGLLRLSRHLTDPEGRIYGTSGYFQVGVRSFRVGGGVLMEINNVQTGGAMTPRF